MIICDHKNIFKGSASPKFYKDIREIALKLGMDQVLEKQLKSGGIQFRFEMWDNIVPDKRIKNG